MSENTSIQLKQASWPVRHRRRRPAAVLNEKRWIGHRHQPVFGFHRWAAVLCGSMVFGWSPAQTKTNAEPPGTESSPAVCNVIPLIAGDRVLVDDTTRTEVIQRLQVAVEGGFGKDSLGQIYKRDLGCYSGGRLFEVCTTSGTYCLVISGKYTLLLDGKSASIHSFNKSVPPVLNTKQDVLEYARLFCAGIGFQLLDDSKQMAWKADASADQMAKIAEMISPYHIEVPPEGLARVGACVLHKGTLFRANFLVHATGTIEMQDDQQIATDLSVRRYRFVEGVWRDSTPSTIRRKSRVKRSEKRAKTLVDRELARVERELAEVGRGLTNIDQENRQLARRKQQLEREREETKQDIARHKRIIEELEREKRIALFDLGGMYLRGEGVARDEAEAVRLYLLAAEAGSARAMFNLGLMFDRGQGVSIDKAEALRWYRNGADAGNAGAIYNLGVKYAKGEGVAKNETEGARWLLKAAMKGNADAMYSVGAMYAEGKGVAKDQAEAVRWFRKAADQGQTDAMYNLGGAYAKGDGVAKDYAKAIHWLRIAADKGDAGAMYNLGIMYSNGWGVAKNQAKAAQWRRKADKATRPAGLRQP